MGTRGAQPLSYGLRLPDEAQADALRLLDATRAVVNATLTQLWPSLDAFASDRAAPAYKHVAQFMGSPEPHGDWQWRCESETAGRILRAQAKRKRAFELIQPILTHGFIRPTTDLKPAGKNRRAIADTLHTLKLVQEDGDHDPEGGETAFVTLQHVVEQACNYYLEHDSFPATYEEMQPIPVLEVGLLSYSGDDGPEKGQAYRLRLDLEAGVASLRFRCPNTQGIWGWRAEEARLPLPTCVHDRLREGELHAPTLREVRRASGERYAVLDLPVAVPVAEPVAWEAVEQVLGVDWGVHTLLTATAVAVPTDTITAPDAGGTTPWRQVGRPFFLNTGGFDGRQARTRRQLDELKAKRDLFTQECETLAQDHPKHAWYIERIAAYDQEITRCWRKYDLRNRTLAHLAANVLLLLCHLHDCSLVTVESLKTLKTTGRGRGVRGRWRNYRNNTTLRGEIWRLLRYKCFLAGIRRHTAKPQHTSHTCPRCGAPAQTYRSPSSRQRGEEAEDWGRWLWCANCGYNGDRDYCASINIARVGVASLVARQQTGVGRAFAVRDPELKPVSYTGAGSALLLPPTGYAPARPVRGKICYLPGWLASAFLQSSQPKAVFLRLCG